MSDMEKPLSAILAEMKRRADEAHDGLNGVADINQIDYMEVEDWVASIEAAVKRERFIADAMLAVKDKPLPHPDPENAPPLFSPMTKTQLQTLSDLVAIAHDEMDGLPHHEQELERFDSLLSDMKGRALSAPPEPRSNAAALRAALKDVLDHAPFATDHATMLTGGNDLLARLRHAYYAPPRNCDRFATGEEAFSKFFVEERVAERLAAKEMECTPQKLRFALACFFADWLFAEAEGGSGEEKK